MSTSKKDIEEALIDGVTKGLTGKKLFSYVQEQCPKAKTKKIVNAAFYSLSDPKLTDRAILDAIYALALSHRLDDAGAGEDEPEPEAAAPVKSKETRRSSGTAETPAHK